MRQHERECEQDTYITQLKIDMIIKRNDVMNACTISCIIESSSYHTLKI